jgi:hypothetical protein
MVRGGDGDPSVVAVGVKLTLLRSFFVFGEAISSGRLRFVELL